MSEFRPAWWLPGGHLPTIWGKKVRRQTHVHDRLERIATPDDDHVTLARMGRASENIPHVLVLHGLEGTLDAKYAHGLLAKARSFGWSGDLLLFRSCDGESNSARRLYHSGETSDIDLIVRRLRVESPQSPLFVCGISLGGNALLKWLGDIGDAAASLISGAAAVSVPFDLGAGSRYLERGFSRFYANHFLATLRPKAIAKARQFPGMLDEHRIRSSRSFWEFDDVVTAPLHGFIDAADYYRQCSSIGVLAQICVPTLLFGAHDDPFVPRAVLARVGEIAATNANLTADFTNRGGHVGWVEGTPWRPRYHMEARVFRWFASVCSQHPSA